MPTVPSVPSPPRNALFNNQLQPYHLAMRPWFEQIAQLLGALTLADNHGAVVAGPFQTVAGADGALSNLFVPCAFTPALVFFRAEALDAAKRSTGSFACGMAHWDNAPQQQEQGFNVTRGPGLTEGTTYTVSIIALPG